MSKQFEKVISPQKFTPAIIEQDINFEQVWQNNKPWVLSNLSHIAYFKSSQIKTFMDKLGAEKTICYDINGAQAFLALWKNKAILVFRGTQSVEYKTKKHKKLSLCRKIIIKLFIKLPINPFSLLFLSNDILADLKFLHHSFGNTNKVRVHTGFLEEINKLWKAISSDIDQQAKNIPAWVTGHSLGGALATLAGMKGSFESVTTFGEPRVGRKINLAFQSKKHTRYVNGDDPVTKLPPKFFSYYKHHGDKVKVRDSDGNTSAIYDHSIIYYSENIKNSQHTA